MSERVENRLTVFGPHRGLKQFQDRARGTMVQYVDEHCDTEGKPLPTEPQLICLDTFIPVPERLRQRTRWGYVESQRGGKPHGTYADDPDECGGSWEESIGVASTGR